MPNNDYNLIVIKISLFIITINSLITINGFFFTDETMHFIYDSKGDVDFLFNIPKAIYSTAISAIINAILKFLALTEYDILLIKKQKTLNDTLVFAKGIKNCLYIKISIYYRISFVLIFFYWYFISCFCAVYNNSQIILIKNCFTSFIISLIYPFGKKIENFYIKLVKS